MSVRLTTKIYAFRGIKDSSRNAEIVFCAVAPNKWKFDRCTFAGCNRVYNLDDWEFLGLLAAEIKSLCEKEGAI